MCRGDLGCRRTELRDRHIAALLAMTAEDRYVALHPCDDRHEVIASGRQAPPVHDLQIASIAEGRKRQVPARLHICRRC
jgi:hypothetical protein